MRTKSELDYKPIIAGPTFAMLLTPQAVKVPVAVVKGKGLSTFVGLEKTIQQFSSSFQDRHRMEALG